MQTGVRGQGFLPKLLGVTKHDKNSNKDHTWTLVIQFFNRLSQVNRSRVVEVHLVKGPLPLLAVVECHWTVRHWGPLIGTNESKCQIFYQWHFTCTLFDQEWFSGKMVISLFSFDGKTPFAAPYYYLRFDNNNGKPCTQVTLNDLQFAHERRGRAW